MAEERAVVEAPGLVIRVVKGPALPSWSGEALTVGDLTLEADIRVASLAWNLTVLLTAPLKFHKGDEAWARSIIREARTRIAEAAYSDIAARLGPLARIAAKSPLLPPALAMHHYPWYSCIWRHSLEEKARAYLERYYSRLWRRLHARRGRRASSGVSSALFPRLAGLARSAAVLLVRPPRALGECGMPDEARDPWVLVRLPEGRYLGGCNGFKERLGLGECRRPVLIGGSRVCESSDGVIVVKDYYWMGVKWLPGFIASARVYGFRLGAKARMAAEAYYLPRLRRLVETPRVIALCSERYRAVMARSYLEGAPVQDSRDPGVWRLMGETLARIHHGGYTLGDPNPGNFLHDNGVVSVIDAEQARRFTPLRAAWDLAEMTLMGLFYGAGEDLARAAVEGYLSTAPGPVLERVLDSQIWLPLAPLQPFTYLARRVVEESYKSVAGRG